MADVQMDVIRRSTNRLGDTIDISNDSTHVGMQSITPTRRDP